MRSISAILILFCFCDLIIGQEAFEKKFVETRTISSNEKSAKAAPMYNALMENYDVKFYKINLEADNDSIYLKGDVTLMASVVSEGLDTFVCELNPDYSIDSILLDETHVSFTRNGDDIVIHLTSPISTGNLFNAQVFYHGSLGSGSQGFFSGISHDDGNNITYTLSEPLYAKDWFPCKQVLTDKADSVYIFVTIDSSLKAGSNGLLTDVVDLGNGKARYEWKSFYPIAYYLISITVGDYLEYNLYAHPEGSEDSILIQNYLYDQTTLDYYKNDIDMTAELIEAYSEIYGPYPFSNEKYGHCMAEIGGGMEHQTMTTLSAFNFELVAHELSHMWFGDNITCATWQDIWINEGFATYSPLLALEYMEGEFPDWTMEGYHYDQFIGATSGSIYIPDEEFDIDFDNYSQVGNLSSRIFDWYLSYEKGAIILHMLRYELNDDELFFNIYRSYQEQYQDSNAIGLDFKEVVENESGRDFTWFFDQWYFGEGYPRYRITWNQVNDTVLIEASQGKSTPSASVFRMNMDYLLSYNGGDTTLRLEQTESTQLFKIPFPSAVTSLEVDSNHWMLAEILEITHGDIDALPEMQSSENAFFYPNPVVDKVHLKNPLIDPSATLSLYDLSGQLVMSFPTVNMETETDLSDLKSGVYIAILRTDSEQTRCKLVKE